MKSPVFIVGSPRSGTSALVDVMLAAGYSGYREGMFLSLLFTLNEAIDKHFAIFAKDAGEKILIANVDAAELKEQFFGIIRQKTDALNTDGPWFDKTGNPEMIRALPIIKRLWPESVVIFAKRRGIENVMSRLRKFPAHDFQYHCKDWAANMHAWRQTRDSISPDSFVEIDQYDMIQNPSRVALQLGALLGVSDIDPLIDTMRSSRPQQTEANSAERVLSIDGLNWSQQQLLSFGRFCGTEMEAYGYAYDEKYRKDGVSPAREAGE
jgi:hypothetical protein